MALVVAVENMAGNVLRYAGGSGVSAGDVVLQTTDVSRYDEFMITCTANDFAVFGSLDDADYASVAVALQDLGSTSLTTSVLVGVAGHIYRIRGVFRYLQVQQSGAGAVAGVSMLCSRKGGQR